MTHCIGNGSQTQIQRNLQNYLQRIKLLTTKWVYQTCKWGVTHKILQVWPYSHPKFVGMALQVTSIIQYWKNVGSGNQFQIKIILVVGKSGSRYLMFKITVRIVIAFFILDSKILVSQWLGYSSFQGLNLELLKTPLMSLSSPATYLGMTLLFFHLVKQIHH